MSSFCKRKEKEYFAKVNEEEITDNKKFWHTVKLFPSDKVKSKETIILVNNDNIESKQTEVAKSINYFSSNTVKNLEIPKYKREDDLHSQLSRSPVLQAITKYRNHPSINTIRRFSQHNSSFYFSPVDKSTLLKEIKSLNANKAVQDNDIPVKVLKENANFFAEQITLQFNEGILFIKIAKSFKVANTTPAFKQGSWNLKDNLDQ